MQDTMRSAPDKAMIRADLERVRDETIALVESISPEAWRKPSGHGSWSVGTLAWHIASGLPFFVAAVEAGRRGKGRSAPGFLIDPVNNLRTKFGARSATPQSVVQDLRAGHDRLFAALESVQDGEWATSSTNFGTTQTVREMFDQPRQHLDEHAPTLRQALGG
ncbi:MAG: maleylpyruvate isomerase N-terminal domain-containing protein [Chloroflexi bacterium]|nr:maleylpyruvate isomerase N-terminal domain-containing protein [Chloroflexota bacterium]